MGPIDLQALLRRLAGNRPTRSIRQLLTRLVLSIMVPLLAFSALVLWRFTELQQQRAEQEALAAATALASDIDRDIRGIIAALTGLASSPALLSDDFATFYVQAQQVATAVGVPILLRDGASGQQVLNTRLPFGAELPLNDPSGIATRVVASRVPYVSNLVFGTVAQKQLVAVAVPVMRGSDVVAVLIASVEGGRIGGVMAEQRLPDMWTLAVSDRDGMIIARSKDADAFIGRRSNLFDANSGRQGVHRVTNLEGIVVLRGYRHTEQGWLVASFTPLRFVNGPLRESWLAFVAIGVVLFALALIVVRWTNLVENMMWSGLLLLYVLYARLGWFPGPGRLEPRSTPPDRITGFYTIDSLLHGNVSLFWEATTHLILPAAVLGWGVVGIVTRLVRASLLDEFSMEYVRVARAMGLRERTVVNTHAMRNALLPTITIVAFTFAFLLTGAVLTETVFSWPGVGNYAVEASRNLDFPAIIGVTIVGGVAFLVTNLITDIAYAFADPRIRLS